MRLEAVLVAHLARAIDPIAEIDEGEPEAPRKLDLLEDHVGAEAARRLVRIVEAVDHGDAVAEAVAQRDADQRRVAGLRVRLQPIFGDARLDHAVLDHQRIVEHRHLGHAAVAVARVDIGAEQRILLGAWGRLHARRHHVAVCPRDPVQRAPGPEGIDQNPHRHAGRAGVAIGHVGDVLAAPETALKQIVDEEARFLPGEMGKQLPLQPAR